MEQFIRWAGVGHMSDFTVGNQTPGKLRHAKYTFSNWLRTSPLLALGSPALFTEIKNIFRISKIITFCKKLQKWGPGAPPAGLQAPGALPGALQAPPPQLVSIFWRIFVISVYATLNEKLRGQVVVKNYEIGTVGKIIQRGTQWWNMCYLIRPRTKIMQFQRW